MVRTQIYLTEDQHSRLSVLSTQYGKKQSELIRQALDRYLVQFNDAHRQAVLDRAVGMWKHRKDLPDFVALRRSWDR